MPEEGLEPTPPCEERILNPPRLPFRHSGLPSRYQLRIPRARLLSSIETPISWTALRTTGVKIAKIAKIATFLG